MFIIKLGTCICIFGQHITGMNDCNEWNREKSHAWKHKGKLGKVKWLKLWQQTYGYSITIMGFIKFQALELCCPI